MLHSLSLIYKLNHTRPIQAASATGEDRNTAIGVLNCNILRGLLSSKFWYFAISSSVTVVNSVYRQL